VTVAHAPIDKARSPRTTKPLPPFIYIPDPGSGPGIRVQMDSNKRHKMIRTKRYLTNEYVEIEAYNLAPNRKPISRAKKSKESTPAQKNLNDRKSRNYFRRLCNNNFGPGDIAVTLTCDDDHLPKDEAEMKRWVRNYFSCLRRAWRKKYGDLEPLKYVYVESDHAGDGSGSQARPHVHIIMSGGLDRDLIESKWDKGFANTKRLQFSEDGIAGLAEYMARQARSKSGKRSWSCSKNLDKPEAVISDRALTKRQLERIVNDPSDGAYIEKLVNKGRKDKYTFTRCEVELDGRQLYGSDIDTGEGMGYSILIYMRRQRPCRI